MVLQPSCFVKINHIHLAFTKTMFSFSSISSEELRHSIITLYQTKYCDSNFTHFTELLGKHEDIHVSTSTVASILEAEYILSPKIRKAKKRRI